MTKKTDEEKNWSQLSETILMINVAVARIEHAMNEGNESFTSLSQSFVETVNSAGKITQAVALLEDSPVKNEITQHCNDISQRVGHSIVAFQFYDKLSQRMHLVSKSLDALTHVLKDESKTHVHDEWLKLQNMIRSKYTLDADQQMFDAVLNGMPIEEALKIAVEKTTEEDIEFF